MPIDVELGGETVALQASPGDVQRVLACAYLVGGFAMVLAVVEQVLAARRRMQQQLDVAEPLARASARSFRAARGHEALTDWNAADERARRVGPELRARLAEADALLSMARSAWSLIAEAEEQALADYEARAVDEFIALAREAQTVVESEWKRYAPCDTTAHPPTPVDMDTAAQGRSDRLSLGAERDALLAAIFELKRGASEYATYLRDARQAADLDYTRRNAPTKDPWKTLKDAQDAASRRLEGFERTRERLGRRYPVALQVYGRLLDGWRWDARVPDAARDRCIETWVIEAMLDTRRQVPQVIADAQRAQLFQPGAVLRRAPVPGLPGGALLSGLEGRAGKAAMVLPASQVIVAHLQHTEMALRAAWLQRPVRFRLRERALGVRQAPGLCLPPDEALMPYFQHGHLHQAALSEVYDAVAELREAAQRRTRRVLMVMDAIALPAAFFTSGWSLVFAGAVHAAVRAEEMGVQIQTYFAEAALAGLSFATIEECIWRPPSTLALASQLIEGGVEVASNVVGGRLGTALDAVQTALALHYGAQAVSHWIEAGAQVDA
jgi:hypothetical protein